MIALIQRVRESWVEVAAARVAAIGPGMLALIGVERGDREAQAQATAGLPHLCGC
jgi:D-tyrosyl-tRNA(Tyr) deacylase